MTATVTTGDCRAVMAAMEPRSVDAVVTDPPYGLSFMGKGWDHAVPGVEFWEAALRVAKPGAHLVAFGGTRTFHRLACAIEDAGWELRDTLGWLYGSGFPKSLDVSKAIDKAKGAGREVVGANPNNRPLCAGKQTRSMAAPITVQPITAPATDLARQWQGWGTALKPAWEPIILARKPLDGTVAGNVERWGVGALNVDGCRVGGGPSLTFPVRRNARIFQTGSGGQNVPSPTLGRWPANIIHDGSEEVLAVFPQSKSTGGCGPASQATALSGVVYGYYSRHKLGSHAGGLGDSGSAARFFKQAHMEDVEWLGQNLPLSDADIAGESLSLQRVLDAIAQEVAANAPFLAGMRFENSTDRSTSATPKESRLIAESVMLAMLCITPRLLLEWQHTRLSPPESPVSVAATKEPTGTMTITASHWRSDGSADPVTFSITPSDSVRGEADSRFMYCAKASKRDRDEGCEGMEARTRAERDGRQMGNNSVGSVGGSGKPVNGTGQRQPARNHHPTVKPTPLMRYLCRLVTPPGGLIFDPFTGSGSTGKAALLEGFRFVGVELNEEYAAIARARMACVEQPEDLFAEAAR